MQTLSMDDFRPMQTREYIRMQPGLVGSVGEVNVTPRLRHSANDMPLRFDPLFSFHNAARVGSGVQNGTSFSPMDGGMGPTTIDSNWTSRRRKIRQGWFMQDIRAPDTMHEPRNSGIPQYSWNNRIATTYELLRTGNQFLPVPGGYVPHPSEVPRGGMAPRLVDNEDREVNTTIRNLLGMQVTRPIVKPVKNRAAMPDMPDNRAVPNMVVHKAKSPSNRSFFSRSMDLAQ